MWLDLRWNMTFNIVCLQTTRRDALCIVFASYHAGSMFRLMRCKQVVGTGQLGKTGIDLHVWHFLDPWVLSETNNKNDIEVCVKIHKKILLMELCGVSRFQSDPLQFISPHLQASSTRGFFGQTVAVWGDEEELLCQKGLRDSCATRPTTWCETPSWRLSRSFWIRYFQRADFPQRTFRVDDVYKWVDDE